MIALSGAAFAQDVPATTTDTPVANATNIDADFTIVNDNTNITSGASLLTQILAAATDVQVSMTNAAENLANLDGSINVLESANVDELLAELTADVVFGSPVYTWTVNTEAGADPETDPATTERSCLGVGGNLKAA